MNVRPGLVSGSFKKFFLKNGPFPATFSLFSSFQYTDDSKQMLYNFLPMTGSNRGPLELEATVLPTEPQPQPKPLFFITE